MSEPPKLDLTWLRQQVPIFNKMVAETEQRKADEDAYKRGDYRPRGAK